MPIYFLVTVLSHPNKGKEFSFSRFIFPFTSFVLSI